MSTAQIKALRERTGAGVIECKKALMEAGGDPEKAVQILRDKGREIAAHKAGRAAHQGLIGSYVHSGRIGVLVEVNCETDFVAKTDQFKTLVQELSLQIASMNPRYVTREEVPPEQIGKALEQLHEEIGGVDDESAQPMQQAHMETFYKERVLLDQPYIKDTARTVQDLLTDTVSSLRENIVIRRFIRFVLGEET
ncbi:MAG: elongation factor Ts [Candidatus Omnitrophica bacterium]|nr:elongation factor Ts [Candidatus Omnitrophota bacterium]